ncbi:hypothetical protein QUA27_25615 [Microcoleus sp. Pol14C6]|uniref:hypothetical protein n=1 Tax=unclassified Microcoleus TaxID=2642155 RepID=UPI002FCFBD03
MSNNQHSNSVNSEKTQLNLISKSQLEDYALGDLFDISGCYGEAGSGLIEIMNSEHKNPITDGEISTITINL